MKYIRKTTEDIKDNFLVKLLEERGYPQDGDWDLYINPTYENEHDPLLLDHVIEGAELLADAIINHKKIYICIDSDVDGFTSAALVYNILHYEYSKYDIQIEYHVPDGKEHGLETLMDIFTEKKICDLIILPDSSSNDYEYHKILKNLGYDILVLDHHNAPQYSEDAIVINNQLSENYPNKSLSGVGVVYKFFEYFQNWFFATYEAKVPEGYEGWEPYTDKYIDLVALGEISDMMNMNTTENRYICDYGLSHINNKLFHDMIYDHCYSIFGIKKEDWNESYITDGKLTQINVAFYITPFINALIRVGTDIQKERLFEAFINPDREVPSTKRGEKGMTETIITQSLRNFTNAKASQKKEVDRAIELLDVQIMNDDLDNNRILILNADDLDIPNTLTGLCAMNISAAHKKPVMLGHITPDGYLRGSIRGREETELKDFQRFLLNSELMEYVDGHPNAAGFGIKLKDIDKLTNYANDKLKDINFNEGFYEADFVVTGNCAHLGEMILDLDRGRRLWGQSNKEPIIIATDVTIDASSIQVIGANKDTVRFTFNGVTYIKFKAKALIDEFRAHSGKINITAAGKCKANEWMGRVTPQILIDEIEIKESSINDF